MREIQQTFPMITFCESIKGIGLKVAGDALQILHCECVYAWFRGQECLYVGHSTNAFKRLLQSNHHVIGVVDQIRDTDELHFFFNADRSVERDLIEAWEPKYNKDGCAQHNRRKTLAEHSALQPTEDAVNPPPNQTK